MHAGELLEELDLQGIVDHQVKAVPGRFQHLLLRKHPFQQHDRPADAFGPQREALLQPGHRKRIRFGQ